MAAHAERLELEERRPVAAAGARGGAAHRRARPRGGRCRPRRSPACRSRGRGRRGACTRTARAPASRGRSGCSRRRTATGSFQTAARFSASWKSPSLVAPSPVNAAATRCSPRSCAARARPSATGSIAPRWLIIPTMRFSSVPKWNVRSRPFVKPPSRPRSWRNSCGRSRSRPVKTPRLRCIGRIESSGSSAVTTPVGDRLLARCPRTTSRAAPAAGGRASSPRSSAGRRIER